MSGYIMDLRKVVGSRPLIMAAAAVIVIDSASRILLQHRSDNDCWGLPGGSMELGETFEETARREVLEETGLTVGQLIPFYTHSGPAAFYRYPNGHEVYVAAIIYTTTDYRGEVKLDNDESVAVAWHRADEIPANLNPLDKPVIEYYLKEAEHAHTTGRH